MCRPKRRRQTSDAVEAVSDRANLTMSTGDGSASCFQSQPYGADEAEAANALEWWCEKPANKTAHNVHSGNNYINNATHFVWQIIACIFSLRLQFQMSEIDVGSSRRAVVGG